MFTSADSQLVQWSANIFVVHIHWVKEFTQQKWHWNVISSACLEGRINRGAKLKSLISLGSKRNKCSGFSLLKWMDAEKGNETLQLFMFDLAKVVLDALFAHWLHPDFNTFESFCNPPEWTETAAAINSEEQSAVTLCRGSVTASDDSSLFLMF